jgi:hypothetical protein
MRIQPRHVGAKLRSPSTDARAFTHCSANERTPRNIRNMHAWRKDRTEKSACAFATSVRHRREMWFRSMRCVGANATRRTTCNHSLEWDRAVSSGQSPQKRPLSPAQNRTVESHGYVLHAARARVYRSEHRDRALLSSCNTASVEAENPSARNVQRFARAPCCTCRSRSRSASSAAAAKALP